MKKIMIVIALVFLLVGCSNSSNEVVPNGEITTKQWNTIIDSAKGTIVNVVYYFIKLHKCVAQINIIFYFNIFSIIIF